MPISNEDRSKRNFEYFQKVFGKTPPDHVMERLESSRVGDANEGVETLEVARVGGGDGGDHLDVLRTGGFGDDDGHDNLEAIIHETGRPAILVEGDTFDTGNLTPEWQSLGESNARQNIETAIMSVGRIEAPFDLRRPYAGTGFVVGDQLIMTNRHVARIFASGIGTSALNFHAGASAGLDFSRERHRKENPPPRVLHVEKVVMIHPYWDMALLKMKENLANDREPLKLSTKTPLELAGRQVIVIGYPGKDTRSNARVRDQIFEGRYGIKRLLPGENDGPAKYGGRDVMAHDTSTLGGASGSAVLDLESGEVVGLHYAGKYMVSNYAVPTSSLAEDSRVAGFMPKLRFAGTRSPNEDIQTIWESLDRGDALSVTQESTEAEEGIFGSPPPKVEPHLPKFDVGSLSETKFSWQTALSTALASHVAYLKEDEIRGNCKSWGLEKVHFIERDNTECFVAGNSETALVAFRGTEKKIKDWLIDLNLIGTTQAYGRVHRGFHAAFQSVAQLLSNAIADLGTPKLVLTGHSLGGALALIAAAEWSSTREINSIYTYGQPAVGKSKFTGLLDDHFRGRYQRFVNDDDIVPLVPPTYRHTGHLSHFGPNTDLKIDNNSTNEALVTSEETCTETQFDHLRMSLLQERLTGTQSQDGTEEGPLPSFRDHSMARYISKIVANAI